MTQAERYTYYNQLIEQHKGILFKVARSYCKDSIDRQDIIQEILIQVWQSLHKYDKSYSITTWLYRISLNVAISHYRKDKTREKYFITLDQDAGDTVLVDNTEQDDRLNLLQQFINELKEVDKALMLLYLDDKSQAEMADIMGISVTNVSTKLGRIKEKLKIRFNQLNN